MYFLACRRQQQRRRRARTAECEYFHYIILFYRICDGIVSEKALTLFTYNNRERIHIYTHPTRFRFCFFFSFNVALSFHSIRSLLLHWFCATDCSILFILTSSFFSLLIFISCFFPALSQRMIFQWLLRCFCHLCRLLSLCFFFLHGLSLVGFFELFFIIFCCLFTKRQKESWRVFILSVFSLRCCFSFISVLSFKVSKRWEIWAWIQNQVVRPQMKISPNSMSIHRRLIATKRTVPDREREWVSFEFCKRIVEGVDGTLAMATHENQLIGLWSLQLCDANWEGVSLLPLLFSFINATIARNADFSSVWSGDMHLIISTHSHTKRKFNLTGAYQEYRING